MSRSLEDLRAWVTGQNRAPETPLRPGIWVVGAGKGGVGTSTVTALLGLASRRHGSRTLVVEGVSGGLALLLGQEGERAGIPDLARPGVEPSALLIPLADGMDFLPAGRWTDGSTQEESERALLLRRASDLYDSYDRVVVDGGSRATTVLAACSAGVERLWVVTLRNRVAAAGAYALVKALGQRYPVLPLSLIANRSDPDEGRQALAAIRSGCRRFLGSIPDEGPILPTDPILVRGLEEGRSILDLQPGAALDLIEQALEPWLNRSAARGTMTQSIRPNGGTVAAPPAGTGHDRSDPSPSVAADDPTLSSHSGPTRHLRPV
jgi:MinD-like ATPase involved in chromosome partitioning or flagellar assembly